MQVRCPKCGKSHQFAEEGFGDQERLDVKCPACGRLIRVVNPKLQTLRLDTTRKKASAISEEMSPDGRLLRLPEDQELSLKVLEGEEKGTVYLLTKPRTLIGRANADILVHDRLASRLHCAVEVGEDGVVLRDLGSTNGTLVNDARIETATLANGSTFRIGKQVFQLLLAPKAA
jgi:phage FluMu protein Com